MKFGSILFLLGLFLGLFFFLNRQKPTNVAVGQNSESTLSSDAPNSSGLATIESNQRDVADSLDHETAPPSPESSELTSFEEGPTCIVIGTIENGAGQPIPDVKVTLSGYKGWAEGSQAKPLPNSQKLLGFLTRSDDLGSFRFAVPVPTVRVTSLRIAGDRFSDSAIFRFGASDQSSLPALTKGPRDMGVITLARTGALAGRVTNETGAPLGKVKISIGPKSNQTYSRDVFTEADGTFLLGHAPVGTYGAGALLKGYLQEFQEPITVQAGQDTLGVDFVLQASPTIEGWVTDENGTALEGVKLGGWPESSGRYASAKSDAQGYFQIFLPQKASLTLEATKKGYASWGDESDRSTIYDPGTHDLRISLQAIAQTKFVVLDEDTGAPVERFGLNIYENEGTQAESNSYTERRRPQVKDHAIGYAEATAREGIDLFLIAADGYILAVDDVQWDEPGEPVQTVRLSRGASVVGRVLHDGGPLAGALVKIVSVAPDFAPGAFDNFNGSMPEPTGYYERDNTRFQVSTGSDGTFELRGLEQGMKRLTVVPTTGAPLIVGPWTIEPKVTHNLGDLHLLEGADVTGTVLLPAGIDPSGLKVYLGNSRSNLSKILDASGHFSFEDLPAVKHTFQLGGRPGVLESGAQTSVELKPGGFAHVEVDARDYAMCHVSLTVRVPGHSLQDSWIYLSSIDNDALEESFHIANSQGKIEGFIRAWGATRIRVGTSGPLLEHPSARLFLAPGGRIEQTVTIETANLSIALPNGTSLPDKGQITLSLMPKSSPFPIVVERSIEQGKFKNGPDTFVRLTEGSIHFHGLPPGEHEFTLEFANTVLLGPGDLPIDVPIRISNGLRSFDEPAYFSKAARITLESGQTTSISL